MLHFRAWELGIKSLYYLRSKSVQRAGFAGGVEADNTPDLKEIELASTRIMTSAWPANDSTQIIELVAARGGRSPCRSVAQRRKGPVRRKAATAARARSIVLMRRDHPDHPRGSA